MTFFARWLRIGFVAGATFGALGCAAILGNDYAVDDDAGLSGLGGSRSSTSSTSTSSVSSTSSSGGRTGSSGGGSSGGGLGGDGAGGSGGDGGLGGSSAGLGGGTAGTITAGGAAGASSGSGGDGGNAGASTGGNGGAFADASNDVSPMDASPDTSMSSDASDAGSTIDAPPEASNCNPLNGACQGGVLTCNPGFSSCNASNADGCECATPACCPGLTCQNQHVACMLAGNPSSPCTDGTGKYYYDCVALGTINSAQATKACAAVTNNASACSLGSCPGQNLVVCSFDGVGNCMCWEYSGPAVGRMYKSNNASCFCPTSTSPMWN